MANEITPATRWEKLLSEVLGEDYAVIPVTRIEKFLANILGEEYDLIPVTRIEKLLAKIAEEGGGGSSAVLDYITGNAPSGDITIEVPQLSSYGVSGRKLLTSLNITTENTVPESAMRNNPGLTKVIIEQTGANKSLGNFALAENPELVYAIIKGTWATLGQNLFRSCAKLKAVDISSATLCGNSCFQYATVLDTIIIRKDSGVVGLNNTNCLMNTPFYSNGTGGTLYVPQALIASYQAANNWSTILGYANNQILPIEGSIYETQYADGTPIT